VNRYFYEIIKTSEPKTIKLVGPLEGIHKTARAVPGERTSFDVDFVQIINGEVKAAFRAKELLQLKQRIEVPNESGNYGGPSGRKIECSS
jgi:hypothetical protein